VRSAHAVFSRPITVEPHVELAVDVVQEGRSIATVIVTAWQNGRDAPCNCIALARN
jgi:acyl-CoA thioesterase-2